jgi:hypothetical protein
MALSHLIVDADELVYALCSNVFNIWKVTLLKLSISLIVLEGLIAEFMISFDAAPYDDDSEFDKDEKTYRAYCTFRYSFVYGCILCEGDCLLGSLVLIEFAILSLPYVILWAITVKPPADTTATSGKVSIAPLTIAEYFSRLVALWDVFGLLNANSDLSSPLHESSSEKV